MSEIISVVVPLFNVEKFLQDFLSTLSKQTYTELEILLIDDGSVDKSGMICDEYALHDKRVKVIHKKNGGQSSARNIGIEMATGSLISFVDADDLLAVDYFEKLYKALKESSANASMCLFQKFYKKPKVTSKLKKTNLRVMSSEKAIEMLCYQKYINNSPYCKLFYKSVIRDIRFPDNRGYEDFAIVYKLIDASRKIVFVNEELYYYRQHNSSTMHAKFNPKKLDRVYISEELSEFVNQKYPRLHSATETRKFMSNLQTLMELPIEKKYSNERSTIWNNILDTRRGVLKNPNVKVSTRIMAFCSYFGIYVMCLLGKLYKIIIINCLKR